MTMEQLEPSENIAGSRALGTSDHHIAPAVSHPGEAMRPDSCAVGVSLGTIQELSHALDAPNLAFTRKELDSHILQSYQRGEKNFHYRSGAKRFLAHLEGQQRSLAEVTKRDLEEWALTPIPPDQGKGKGDLPSGRAFQGAKELCAFAAQVGYIDAQRAETLAECTRPRIDLNVVRYQLHNPMLSREERESHIRQSYQSAEKDAHRKAGAIKFWGYLKSQNKSLAEVSTSDLERWALMLVPNRTDKFSVRSARTFDGAKALCALAGEVGYIDMRAAKDLAEFKRPHFTVDSLRSLLQNPALTRKEREANILFNFQSSEKNPNRLAGAAGFQAYLESAEIPLSAVSPSDLKSWALTPMRGSGNIPDAQAFEGAKALCALAAEVGYSDIQQAQKLATFPRPHFTVDSLHSLLQNPGLSHKERDYHISLTYQSLEKDPHRQAGARAIMAYLEKQSRSLSELTSSDLQHWAFTPIATGQGKGTVPTVGSFEGAKALCALAAEVEYIDAQQAQDLALCMRPQGDVDSLRRLLQNPELTPKQRDYQIRLKYHRAEKNAHHQTGANAFLAYLESQDLSLAEASKSDLETWALTPIATGRSKNNLPSRRAFEGAKALCALAAQVGHFDAQQAQAIATCTRPGFDAGLLRMDLQNAALTPKEREDHILLNYQSVVKNHHVLAGANGFCAYLERQERSLAEVTKSDLEEWARTPIITAQGKGKGTLPSKRVFLGAKVLCALAAQVGYIDAQRAAEIAESRRPPAGAASTSTLTFTQAGLDVAESSSAMPERANKRLRTDDQAASPSLFHSFALPQSDALLRELALSPPSLLDPNEQTRCSQRGGTLSLIDELESLEDILGSCGNLY